MKNSKDYLKCHTKFVNSMVVASPLFRESHV